MYNLSHLYLPPSPSPIVFDVKTALQRSMRRWAFVEVVDFRRRMSLQAATRAQCSATLLRGPRGVKVLLVARVLRAKGGKGAEDEKETDYRVQTLLHDVDEVKCHEKQKKLTAH